MCAADKRMEELPYTRLGQSPNHIECRLEMGMRRWRQLPHWRILLAPHLPSGNSGMSVQESIFWFLVAWETRFWNISFEDSRTNRSNFINWTQRERVKRKHLSRSCWLMLCKRCSPSMWASKSICNAATWRRSVAASDAGGTINPSARRRGPTRSEGWWPAAGVGLLPLAPPKFGPILVKELLPMGLSAGMTVDGGLQNATVLLGQGLPPPGLVRPDMRLKLTQLRPPGTSTFHP